MIKKFIVAAALITGLILSAHFLHLAFTSASAQTAQDDSSMVKEADRSIDNVAFGPGEKLNYDIGYGFINAGSATLEVTDLIEYNNRPCFLIQSTANSNKFFSSFYRVEDRVKSIIDAAGLYSWKFEKYLSEGNYKAQTAYGFDQSNHSVFFGRDTLPVAPFVQDALSILYYIRTQNLKVGQSVYVDNFTDGQSYKMEIRVHRKELVKVKAGRFDCIVVEPLLLTSGIFKHEGKLTVWLTDDRLKLPVLMKSKVLVGSITAELTNYRLGEIL
ncbi:MAG: DUF3108 domain-containing protein [candidate division Zixibacteria bacterium]|nr:DUF3108 domain-containing protein [candidate division Zixibacteria bacterium]